MRISIFKLAVEIEQAIEEKRKMLHQERKKEKELEKRVGFYFKDSSFFKAKAFSSLSFKLSQGTSLLK